MDQYPEELRTPPMPLVALVGMHELHSMISLSLQSEQPPLNTLAIPDFSKVAVVGGKERKAVDARMPPPVGILKADWLAKHRTRSPAVLAVLLDREQVYGDPIQWLRVCENIDTIKNVIRGRNTKLVIAIVQPTLSGDVNEDRLTALRKRAEIDAKNCLVFITGDPTELKRSLSRLGSVMGELANIYYRDEGRRVKLRLEKKTYSSVELSVRYNFKVAVFAEFRRDWVTALKFYETAYSLLLEVSTTHMELQPVQRIVELKAVAEQLHFKISTLLLHSGKESEAVKWFRQHIALYKPIVGPPDGAFLHWGWVSKQFQVFAELLENSLGTSSLTVATVLSPGPPVTDRELQPGYYLQLAASHMAQRRRAFEAALATFEAFDEEGAVDVLAGPREDIGPALYVGQSPRLLKRGNTPDVQSPTEAEFMRHAIMVEKSFSHSHAAIALLTKAHDLFKARQATRIIYQLGSEMGREYYNAREYEKAKRLFDSVAGMYRKEAWVVLLGATLGYLRECARQLGLLQEYVEYALELASLPIPLNSGPNVEQSVISGPEVGPAGPPGQFQREQVYQEVMGLLRGTGSVLPAREGESGLLVTSEHGVALEVDLVSPLRIALSGCVAFHDQVVRPGVKTPLTVSLLTHLPLPVVLVELEVHFNQPGCGFILKNKASPLLDDSALVPQGPSTEGLSTKDDCDLKLEPRKWKRFTVDIIPSQSGKLECTAVVARVGPHATLRCQVESPATRDVIPLWIYEPGLYTTPVKDTTLAYFGQKTIQVEEPEALVDVQLKTSGPGLVGEAYPVSLVVVSKGHKLKSGELDAHLGTLPSASSATPRFGAPTPASIRDGMELLVADSEEQGSYMPFSGPLLVPPLEVDQSWSTTMFVRWLEPKSVNLIGLLGYQTEGSSASEEEGKARHIFRVETSVHLECEEALDVSYQYVAPFRKDYLLPSGLAPGQPKPAIALPLNEASALVVTVKNASSVSVRLLSANVLEKSTEDCTVRKAGSHIDSTGVILSSSEVFSQLFHVRPSTASTLDIGTIELSWQRAEASEAANQSDMPEGSLSSAGRFPSPLVRYFPMSPVLVEAPPLVVTFDCPPYGLLGVPFMCSIKVQNGTDNLQEVSFSVFDTQSFIFAGAHSDTLAILPKCTHTLSYKLVPIAAGMQQLPQVRFTSTRYSAGFQPSPLSTQLFIYPNAPHVNSQLLSEQSRTSTESVNMKAG
ncbi:unnamed protein product [Calypogeia fissa]